MFGLSSSGLEMAEPQVQNSALIGVIKLEPMDKAAYDTQVKNVEEFILESGLSPGVAKTLIDDVKVKKMGHLELIVDRKVNLTQYFKPLQAAEVIDRLAVHWSLGSRGSNKHKDAADVLKSQGFHQLHADSPPNLPLYSVSNCEMYLPVYMSVTIKSLRQINEMLSTVDISMTLMIRILLGGMDDSVRAMIIEGLALRVNDKAQDSSVARVELKDDMLVIIKVGSALAVTCQDARGDLCLLVAMVQRLEMQGLPFQAGEKESMITWAKFPFDTPLMTFRLELNSVSINEGTFAGWKIRSAKKLFLLREGEVIIASRNYSQVQFPRVRRRIF